MIALYVGLLVYAVVFPSICAFALVRGDTSARQVAIAYLIAAAVTLFVSILGNRHGPHWYVIAVDCIFLVALVAIARRSTRFWPLWAAASQLAGVLAHFPAIIDPAIPKEVYMSTQPFWAFPLLGSLLLGTLSAHRAKTNNQARSSSYDLRNRR